MTWAEFNALINSPVGVVDQVWFALPTGVRAYLSGIYHNPQIHSEGQFSLYGQVEVTGTSILNGRQIASLVKNAGAANMLMDMLVDGILYAVTTTVTYPAPKVLQIALEAL